MKRHIDDIKAEARAVVEAAERWADWRDRNAQAIESLILCYSDEDAKKILDALREEFWGTP